MVVCSTGTRPKQSSPPGCPTWWGPNSPQVLPLLAGNWVLLPGVDFWPPPVHYTGIFLNVYFLVGGVLCYICICVCLYVYTHTHISIIYMLLFAKILLTTAEGTGLGARPRSWVWRGLCLSWLCSSLLDNTLNFPLEIQPFSLQFHSWYLLWFWVTSVPIYLLLAPSQDLG